MDLFVSRSYRNPHSAGTKAKTDIERLLEEDGAVNIGLSTETDSGKVRAFMRNLAGVVRASLAMKRGDTLVLQYPLKKYFKLLCRVARWRGVATVVLIHDLGSFRRKALSPAKEIRRMSQADYFIAANGNMRRWLMAHGLDKKMGLQWVWDYLSDAEAPERVWPDGKPIVCYAGTLRRRKNEFLYTWGPEIKGFEVNLYGTGFEEETALCGEKFRCMGFVPSDRLISEMEGHFGLVWDGDSTDACAGDFGEYLKYNNPHKAGLYIRSGLPLIVWRGSGMAEFVECEGIGVVVDNLACINEIVATMTSERYAAMVANVRRVSEQIAEGEYFRRALAQAKQWLAASSRDKSEHIYAIDDKNEALARSLLRNGADGEMIYQARNKVYRLITDDGDEVCVKAFKEPGWVNSMIYTHFRKSKARRSFENACRLLDLGIGTPEPLAYGEVIKGGRLRQSVYICRYEPTDNLRNWELRDDAEQLVEAYAQLMCELHHKNVWHKDLTPGNVLFRANCHGGYDFFLIDLNRMQFDVKSWSKKMTNFRAINLDANETARLGRAYARACGLPEESMDIVARRQLARYFADKRRHKFVKRLLGRGK